jgi:hypothetical protein
LQTNIVDIDVHETDRGVADEITVDAPASATVDTIRHALVAAGARRVDAATREDASDRDVGVRALHAAGALLGVVVARGIAEAVTEVVPVDRASLEPLTALRLSDHDGALLAVGIPVLLTTHATTGDSFGAIVPRVGLGPVVFDALVLERVRAPFSVTEIARVRALLRFDVARIVASNARFVMGTTG